MDRTDDAEAEQPPIDPFQKALGLLVRREHSRQELKRKLADRGAMADCSDEALERLKPDRGSAVVALTHDPKLDDPALAAALRSECFYIGALGSRRNHAGRCARLKELGFGDDDLARIHGPVGLAIGAVSPAEVAVSIVAEMTRVLRQGVAAEAG